MKTSHFARTAGSFTVTGSSFSSTTRPIFSGIPQATQLPRGADRACRAISDDTPRGSLAREAFPLSGRTVNSPEAGPSRIDDMGGSFLSGRQYAAHGTGGKPCAHPPPGPCIRPCPPDNEDEVSERKDKASAVAAPSRRLPLWKTVLLLLAAVLTLVGLALEGYGRLAAPPEDAPSDAAGGTRPGAIGFAPEDVRPSGATGSPSEMQSIQVWSPVVFRMGFSFLVGFCVAYALRAFVKVAILAVGMALLVIVGLHYAGLIDVDYSAMERGYDRLAEWAGAQTAGFREFLTGYLPSTASAALGLFAGFKRH